MDNNTIWRNFINKPRLSNYISSPAEINFNKYGATLSFAGTITAHSTVALVHNICTEITLKGQKIHRYMDWFAFRPPHYIMGNFSGLELTMTSKFTISQEQAFEYNLLFVDTNSYSQMKPIVQAVKDAWEEAIVVASKNEQKINFESLFEEFKKLKLVNEAVERLKKECPWKSGEYTAKMRITTASPKQIFDMKKVFTLSDEDVAILRDNSPAIIADLCQQPKIAYASVTPTLT